MSVVPRWRSILTSLDLRWLMHEKYHNTDKKSIESGATRRVAPLIFLNYRNYGRAIDQSPPPPSPLMSPGFMFAAYM